MSTPVTEGAGGRGTPGGWLRDLLQPQRLGLAVAAPLLALLVALVVAYLAIRLNGNAPFGVFADVFTAGTKAGQVVRTVDLAVPYFLSGIAVALSFRMALFNIGVEGQYRLAALIAAYLGAQVTFLPAPLHVLFIVLVAVVVGAAWSGIAGLLKTYRGVSEVISTIMLNQIAGLLIAYLLATYLRDPAALASGSIPTKQIPASGLVPSLNRLLSAIGIDVPEGYSVTGLLVLAIVVGVGFWLLLSRTRFGFDLRATGINPFAARASGVNAGAMVVKTMLLSGAIAGLVGLPYLLDATSGGSYDLSFPQQYGFTGIGVALLGRNRAGGIALAAVLFAFLENASPALQADNVPPEIATIMEGTTVLSVVIAYEVVRRIRARQQQRAAAIGAPPAPAAGAAPVVSQQPS